MNTEQTSKIIFMYIKGTLFNKKRYQTQNKIIQSKKHKVGTYKINKISLSCFVTIAFS